MNVFIKNVGKIKLSDKNYIAEGGEAKVYSHGNWALKIYHDENKVIPVEKIKELLNISADNVLKPLQIIYRFNDKKPVGYAMGFAKNTYPMCKLFTKGFKNTNNIEYKDINELVKKNTKNC